MFPHLNCIPIQYIFTYATIKMMTAYQALFAAVFVLGSIVKVVAHTEPLNIMIKPFFLHVTFGVFLYSILLSLVIFQGAAVNFAMSLHRYIFINSLLIKE
jgi:hypothetical protein